MKYGDITLGQLEAVFNLIGGQEVLEALLRGEKIVRIENAIQSLFDSHGRRIPKGLLASVRDADPNVQLRHPDLKFWINQDTFHVNDALTRRVTRLNECLGIGTNIDFRQFEREINRLLALIRDNQLIANILNGVWLPVILPSISIGEPDPLNKIIKRYLEAVTEKYVSTSDGREFSNYCEDGLAGEVRFGSGHPIWLTTKMAQGLVVGIYFPVSLQGFSIEASQEQMSTLPEGFSLSGMDALVAMIMYPDLLARDSNVPTLDLAAFSWYNKSIGHASFSFEVSTGSLGFNQAVVDIAHDNSSSGLFFTSPDSIDL